MKAYTKTQRATDYESRLVGLGIINPLLRFGGFMHMCGHSWETGAHLLGITMVRAMVQLHLPRAKTPVCQSATCVLASEPRKAFLCCPTCCAIWQSKRARTRRKFRAKNTVPTAGSRKEHRGISSAAFLCDRNGNLTNWI